MNLPLRAALASAAASPAAALRSAAAVATAAAAGSVAYVRSWHPSTAEVEVAAARPAAPAAGGRWRRRRGAGAEEGDGKQQQQQKQQQEQGAAAAEAERGGAKKAAADEQRRPSPDASPPGPPIKLPRLVVEALCGSAGEMAQVGVLYPLETLKVRCQSENQSVRRVFAAMVSAAGAQGGGGAARAQRVLAALYSGFGSAAAFSVVVGAVHYASFCASKRMALADGNVGAGVAAAQAETKQQRRKSKKHQQQRQQQQASPSPSSASDDVGGHGGGGNAGANLTAASVGALVTALVESPAELFRHRAQAGMLHHSGGGHGGHGGGGASSARGGGSVWRAMRQAVKLGGPGALFYGFGAYLMESVPYDVAELGVYGSLRDWIDGRRAALGVADDGGSGGGGGAAAAAWPSAAAASGLLLGGGDARDGGFAVAAGGGRGQRRRRQQQQEAPAAAAASSSSSSSSPAELLRRQVGAWSDAIVAGAPPEALDLAAGAAAGTAAVFISMPLDVIKTYVQTHPEEAARAAERALASFPALVRGNGVAKFAAVGAELARRGGGGALLAGLAPRLAQQVPSAMLCWLVLERCRAGLEPFIAAS
jgi:hypothetical protein